VKAYDGEPEAPCGHVEVGFVDVSCVAQAGVRVIAKVRATTTRNGGVASLHAVEVLPCVVNGPIFPKN
jgi:hypothetical protein